MAFKRGGKEDNAARTGRKRSLKMKTTIRNGSIVASVFLTVFLLAAAPVQGAASVTGDPVADAWISGGHSLQNGVYVRQNANYGFGIYSTAITVQAGSNLEISDGANSWLAGDTVLGVGGRFAGITAAAAGWSAFTGNGVNAILGEDTKFVAKFGTSAATFAASAIAPDLGNGLGSMGTNGGSGAVQVRTTGWFYAADWLAGSGSLQLLNKVDHIDRNGTARPDADVARLIWNWDATNGYVDAWEILLNTSLMNRLAPGFAGPTPAAGDLAVMAVQRRDGVYTDALVTVVPEPATMTLLALGGVAALIRRKRRA